MLLMNWQTEKLPQGLRKANACGGDVRRKDGYNRRLQSPTKQESPLVRVGAPRRRGGGGCQRNSLLLLALLSI